MWLILVDYWDYVLDLVSSLEWKFVFGVAVAAKDWERKVQDEIKFLKASKFEKKNQISNSQDYKH